MFKMPSFGKAGVVALWRFRLGRKQGALGWVVECKANKVSGSEGGCLFAAGWRCVCGRASNSFSSGLAHAIVVNGGSAAQNRI